MDNSNKCGKGARKDALDPTLSAGDLVLCRGGYATVTDIRHHAPGQHDESPVRDDWAAVEIITVRGSRWYGRKPRYAIEVTRHVVAYHAERCEITEADHECTADCTWLDGDKRELEAPATETITPDADDLEWHDGSVIVWAADHIWTKTDATEPSVSPVPDTLGEHEWLSGAHADPYEGDWRVTETTVRLTGDWTPEERAQVFDRIAR